MFMETTFGRFAAYAAHISKDLYDREIYSGKEGDHSEIIKSTNELKKGKGAWLARMYFLSIHIEY